MQKISRLHQLVAVLAVALCSSRYQFTFRFQAEAIDAAVEALKMGWLGMGSYVEEFENQIAKICNFPKKTDRYIAAVSTGHAALHLSLLLMGVKQNDEVITPSFNNAADFQAIRACFC